MSVSETVTPGPRGVTVGEVGEERTSRVCTVEGRLMGVGGGREQVSGPSRFPYRRDRHQD